MNVIVAGGVFKTFGVIFTKVEAKYNSSAAIISWIPSVAIAIASVLGKRHGISMSRFGLHCRPLRLLRVQHIFYAYMYAHIWRCR